MFKAETPVYADVPPQSAEQGGVRLREDVLYANHKGQRKDRLKRGKQKLARNILGALPRFLKADESVLYIARMQSPASLADTMTFGVYLPAVTGAIVVFTNRRILQLRVGVFDAWKKSIWACEYSDLIEATTKGWLQKSLRLQFKDGSSSKYWSVRRADAKVLKGLLPKLLEANVGMAGPSGKMVPFCPECAAALTMGEYQCAGCGLIFKNETTAKWLAFIPGAAYFYCRRWGLGLLDLYAEGYLLLLGIVVISSLARSLSAKKQAIHTADLAAVMVPLLFLLILDITITIYHCRRFVRDYIPTGKKAPMQEAKTTATSSSW